MNSASLTLDQAKDQFTCNVCLGFITNPMKITECGHSFCADCLHKLINASGDKLSCTRCLNPFKRESITANSDMTTQMFQQTT